jgi:hypothetical protein
MAQEIIDETSDSSTRRAKLDCYYLGGRPASASGSRAGNRLRPQPFGDGRTHQHRNNDADNPHDTLLIWKAMFDEFNEEADTRQPTARSNSILTFRVGRAG